MLTELVIVVLFFSLISVIVTQMFVATTQKSQLNQRTQYALIAAQDCAEQLYAEDDMAAFLIESGYDLTQENRYEKSLPAQKLLVEVQILPARQSDAGKLISAQVLVWDAVRAPENRDADDTACLVKLPVERYIPMEEALP